MSRECKCGDLKGHALAVQGAVMQCLFNAQNDPDNEEKWRKQADKLDGKFITEHGMHPYTAIYER